MDPFLAHVGQGKRQRGRAPVEFEGGNPVAREVWFVATDTTANGETNELPATRDYSFHSEFVVVFHGNYFPTKL